MATVKVSPKFQVVIPKDVRERMDLRAGAELHVVEYDGRIEMIPVMPLREMKGFLRGIDPAVPREEDRV